MSKYRYVYTVFWKDDYIQNLNEDEKLLFVYLLTNEDTKQCGVYTFNKDICYVMTKIKNINEILYKFINDGKIKYNKDTNEIAIKNWNKYNKSKSPKVIKHIADCLQNIKDKTLINFCYSDLDLQEMEKIMQKASKKKLPKFKNKNNLRLFDNFYLENNLTFDDDEFEPLENEIRNNVRMVI